jgi:hypothetical protein
MAPGFLLYRDFVTVPVPVLNAAALGAGGAPRSVPLEVVTALRSWLVLIIKGVEQQNKRLEAPGFSAVPITEGTIGYTAATIKKNVADLGSKARCSAS